MEVVDKLSRIFRLTAGEVDILDTEEPFTAEGLSVGVAKDSGEDVAEVHTAAGGGGESADVSHGKSMNNSTRGVVRKSQLVQSVE